MSTYNENARPKVTTSILLDMKRKGEKIAALTSYDYTMASIVDAAGVDMILVGDSASNVMLGNETTLPITLAEMITYAKGVVRGAKRAFVVVDMPFGTYQGDPLQAYHSAVKIMRETGAAAVKLEGGREIRESVEKILSAGIPIVGHLGLTPQSINKFGGYGLRAKEDAEAQRLIEDARMLDEMGVCAIVVEKVPSSLGEKVAKAVSVPVIGIGAGAAVDGQILVVQDMLGMNKAFKPKFVRRFADVEEVMTNGLTGYVDAVKDSTFPNEREQY